MESKELKQPITSTTPEGDVVNQVASYLIKHGKFNAIKIANMVFEALQNNNAVELMDVDREIVRQCLENIRTHALWEKWGD
jgi:predicted DNA-binding protein (UPF0251 family)